MDIEPIPLDLIHGLNNISIQRIDAEGRMSTPADVDVFLFPGAFSGSPPQLTTFEPETPTFQLSGNASEDISRLRPRFQLALQDVDGDLARIRFTLRKPPSFDVLLARAYSPEALGLTIYRPPIQPKEPECRPLPETPPTALFPLIPRPESSILLLTVNGNRPSAGHNHPSTYYLPRTCPLRKSHFASSNKNRALPKTFSAV